MSGFSTVACTAQQHQKMAYAQDSGPPTLGAPFFHSDMVLNAPEGVRHD
jgi:hypothetical protein